jgi:hypothetical protein
MAKSSNSNSGANAALAGGFLSSGAGSGVVCTPEDKSFTCQLKRTVSNVQSVIFILLVLWLIYYVFQNRKNIFKK